MSVMANSLLQNFLYINVWTCASVATVQANVFPKNDIIVPSKFGKFVGIFAKIDKWEN